MSVALRSVLRLVAIGVVGGVLSAPLAATPYLPRDDRELLAEVPAGAHHAELNARQLAHSRLDVAIPLAQFYVQQARRSGDLRFLGYAEAALAPWVGKNTVNPGALVLQATVQQSRHDFAGALVTLDRTLAARPNDPQAWLTRATVLRVLGRFTEASTACAQFARWADPEVSVICQQGILGLAGHLDSAYAILAAASTQGMVDLERSWRASELGDMAVRLGRDADAERYYRAALQATPGDFYLRAALADLLLRQRRSAETLVELAGHESIEPLLLRLAIAQRQERDPGLRHSRELLLAAFSAEAARGEAIHRREQARFLLEVEDRPREALGVALANWSLQREPDDLLILVQAARAAGSLGEADAALNFARAQGLHDARLSLLGISL